MAIVFYAADNETPNSVPIVVRGFRNGSERTVYLRAELDEDAWPGPAMDKAKPLKGEIPLNAIPNSVVIVPKVRPE